MKIINCNNKITWWNQETSIIKPAAVNVEECPLRIIWLAKHSPSSHHSRLKVNVAIPTPLATSPHWPRIQTNRRTNKSPSIRNFNLNTTQTALLRIEDWIKIHNNSTIPQIARQQLPRPHADTQSASLPKIKKSWLMQIKVQLKAAVTIQWRSGWAPSQLSTIQVASFQRLQLGRSSVTSRVET